MELDKIYHTPVNSETIYNREITLTTNHGVAIEIGMEIPPFLVLRDPKNKKNLYYFSPNGWRNKTSRLSPFIESSKLLLGREDGYVPIPNTETLGVYSTISRNHGEVSLERDGRITLVDTSTNGTKYRQINKINQNWQNSVLMREAVFIDPNVAKITLNLGQTKQLVELVRESRGVIVRVNGKEYRELSPSKKPTFLTLGRENFRPDNTISRSHLSIILMPAGEVYVFDHSTNGTKIDWVNIAHQTYESGKIEPNFYIPEVILSRIAHREQQIKNDRHSAGGDYYLFGSDVVRDYELLRKGGNVAVLMDTATIQQNAYARPENTTKPFACFFLKRYYDYISQGNSPDTAMSNAYNDALNENLGQFKGYQVDATFTAIAIIENKAYCLWIGNTEAVIVNKGNVRQELATKKAMEGEKYYDRKLNAWISPTYLISSGKNRARMSSAVLLPGDIIYLYTDGLENLNPKDPKKSLSNYDDVVLIGIGPIR